MAKTVSVIIPSRNEQQNLIWTLQGLQLELAGIDHEVIAILNQDDKTDLESISRFHPVKIGQYKILRYDDNPSCWQARNYGASLATGRYLAFIDSHVMFRPGDLRNGLKYHDEFEGILHFGVNYWLDHPKRTLFQYKWQPNKFWGSWTREKPQKPCNILMSGFCVTIIQREIWQKIGGLHPNLGIYGGGEPYLDLKCQMFGYDVRCNPAFQVYHLAEKRGYAWNNDDLWRNFMISSYALGGNEYLDPVYRHYQDRCNNHQPYLDKLDELRDEAILLAQDDHATIQGSAKRSLNEVLSKWQ